jgi:hypothetical protein
MLIPPASQAEWYEVREFPAQSLSKCTTLRTAIDRQNK